MPPMVDQSKMNPDSFWLGIVKTAVAQILVLVALAAAIVWYVNWSSEAAMSEFMQRWTRRRSSGPNLHPQSRAPVQTVKGKAVCVRKLGA